MTQKLELNIQFERQVGGGLGHPEQNPCRHLEFRRFGFLCLLTFFALALLG
jgi:hypothetical protein